MDINEKYHLIFLKNVFYEEKLGKFTMMKKFLANFDFNFEISGVADISEYSN